MKVDKIHIFVMFIINLQCVFLAMLMMNRLGGGYAATNLTFVFEMQSYVSFVLFLYFLFKKDKEKRNLFTMLNCVSATGCVAGSTIFSLCGSII